MRCLITTLAVVAFGLGLMACGTTSDVRPTALLDELVAVNGARMHIRCIGHGDQTVVLVAGFNDPGTNWTAVEGTISETSRVCSYARYGTGTSDPPPTSQTFTTQADDLWALLLAAHEQGPFVVVGHSYGGAQAVAFTDAHREDVNGLLLIDATPVTWSAAVCEVEHDGTEAAARLINDCESQHDPNSNDEHLDASQAFTQVAKITSLDDVPMTVMTAVDHPFPGLNPTVEQQLNTTWVGGQHHWLTLSDQSTLVSVRNTGHYIQLDQPSAVIEQVALLL
jgi:pimeloyl-ACP methyl ester carboxylesterase